MRPVLFSTLTKGGDARTFSSVLTHSCHRNITFSCHRNITHSCHRNITHSCHRNMALLQVWPWILGFGQLWAALEMETWFGLEGWYGQAVMMGRPSWVGFDGSRICIVLNIEHLPVIHPDENPTKVRTLDGRASVRKSTIVILICFLIPPNPPFPSLFIIIKLDHLVLEENPSIVDVLLAELTHLHQHHHPLCLWRINIVNVATSLGEPTLLLGSSVYTSSPLGVALDSNLMSSGFVSMSMSTNNRSLSVEEEDKVKVFSRCSSYQKDL